jgi:hypothetical protein
MTVSNYRRELHSRYRQAAADLRSSALDNENSSAKDR